jgi:hypothetical protein
VVSSLECASVFLPGGSKRPFYCGNPPFVALVEGPLLDPFGSDEPRVSQDPEVFAGRRRADPELLGDEHAADAVADQIAVDLGREMRPWPLEPGQDLQAALVSESLDDLD